MNRTSLPLLTACMMLAAVPGSPLADPAPGAEVVAPRPLAEPDLVYPEKALQRGLERDVVVIIAVDEWGRVIEASRAGRAGHGFGKAAVRAARAMRFEPARRGGEPVPVKIRYTFRFRLPEPGAPAGEEPGEERGAAPAEEPDEARLTVIVVADAGGAPIAGAEVTVPDLAVSATTDARGRVDLRVPGGRHAIVVDDGAHVPYDGTEIVDAGEHLTVRYRLDRADDAEYRTDVWAQRQRAEVGRVTLVGDELTHVPGTMGDPMRVIALMPGVTTSMSGMGYPIVRGALPGDSRFEIDGIEVPMLYHMLLGMSVVHPRFIEQITFEPGGYSARSGRAIGGRVSAAITEPPERSESQLALSVVDASVYSAVRLGDDTSLVAATRAGTLGLVAKLFDPNLTLQYFDYQTRARHRLSDDSAVTATVLGVIDVFNYEENDGDNGDADDGFDMGFHRADLRYDRVGDRGYLRVGGQLELDSFQFQVSDEVQSASSRGVRPYVELGYELSPRLRIGLGGDVQRVTMEREGADIFADLEQDAGPGSGDAPMGQRIFTRPLSSTTTGGWLTAEYTRGDLVIAPSVRFDHYHFETADGIFGHTAVDPRVEASLRLGDSVEVEASAGLFTGPARLTVAEGPFVAGPVPGAQGLAARHPLSRARHYQAGVEMDLPGDLQAVATAFYQESELGVDYSLFFNELGFDSDTVCGVVDATDALGLVMSPLGVRGSTRGAEVLVRRKLGHAVSGWLSYTASRTDREFATVGRVPYEYDNTHVLNAALQWRVGKWHLGSAVHYHTGRPYTSVQNIQCSGNPGAILDSARNALNGSRLPGYWRLDARAERRFRIRGLILDVYLDFFNALLQDEVLAVRMDSPGQPPREETVPLYVPMLGLKGLF